MTIFYNTTLKLKLLLCLERLIINYFPYRFLQRIPQEFLSSGALPTVMQCASLACCLDHRDANSSVMKFLYDFTKVANSTRSDKQQIKGNNKPAY